MLCFYSFIRRSLVFISAAHILIGKFSCVCWPGVRLQYRFWSVYPKVDISVRRPERYLTYSSGISKSAGPNPLRTGQPVQCDQYVYLSCFKPVMVLNSSCSLGPSGLSPSHTNQRPSSGPFTASLGAPLIYESFPKENMPPQQVLIQTYRTGLV